MGDYQKLVRRFRETGAAAFAAKRAVDEAFEAGLRDRDPQAYARLLAEFDARQNAAWPQGTPDLHHDLTRGAPRAIDTATAFLEADPYFFRSGYMKAALIRRLKRTAFSPAQASRLRRIVLARVDGPDRNEFASYCRLALAVRSAELEAEIERRTTSDDPGVARRARWMALRFASVPARAGRVVKAARNAAIVAPCTRRSPTTSR